MKIKRFFATDIRQAIAQVREELGADAVILSNRGVDGGVEIVAAMDYDEESVREAAQAQEPASPGRARPGPVDLAATLAAARKAANSEKKPPAGASKIPAWRSSAARPEGIAPNRPVASMAEHQVKKGNRVAREERIAEEDGTLAQLHREIQMLKFMVGSQLSEFAWDQMNRRNPHRVQLLRQLTNLGLSAELCQELADQVDFEPEVEQAWKLALKALARQLPVTENNLLEDGGVLALVGPTGVGKTTSIAKLAARFSLRHGHRHLALVTTDGFRIGAHDQLLNYGRILDVPVRIAHNAEDLHDILNGFADKRLVLVDTAGMGQRDERLEQQFSVLRDCGVPLTSLLVLSATTQRFGLEEILPAYAALQPAACLLTKVDEAGSLGEVFSALMRHRLPLAWFADGQRVPEDLHPARAASLVERAEQLLNGHRELVQDELMAMTFGGLAVHAGVTVNR